MVEDGIDTLGGSGEMMEGVVGSALIGVAQSDWSGTTSLVKFEVCFRKVMMTATTGCCEMCCQHNQASSRMPSF